MSSHSYNTYHFGALFLALALVLTPAMGHAQGLAELTATTEGMNALNEQSPSTGAGYIALDRARALGGEGQGEANAATPAPAQAPRPAARAAAADSFDAFGDEEDVPKVTVITGTRVFDAITGELIDDAVMKDLPETERDNFFDDGTHGDLLAADGIYTSVDSRSDVINQSNQRVKEHLIMALISADDLNPLEFYGFNIMSIERNQTVDRQRAWKLVPDPAGVGYILDEVETGQPVSVPKYREWVTEKDRKVKNDWSYRFLQEYRLNKDSLESEFYALYIPLPPQTPSVEPPPLGMWEPFADPQALMRYKESQLQEAEAKFNELRRESTGGGGMGGGGGMAGAPGGM